ncbi:glyoxalase [bacterium]|nr:glyoxalase [bacterium]
MHIECFKYVLYVIDMSRAVRFYQQAFGLQAKLETPHWSEVTWGDVILGLHAGAEPEQRTTGVSLQVTDLDAALQEVVAAGGRIIDPPVSRPGEPIRLATIADTENNTLMMTQYIG